MQNIYRIFIKNTGSQKSEVRADFVMSPNETCLRMNAAEITSKKTKTSNKTKQKLYDFGILTHLLHDDSRSSAK